MPIPQRLCCVLLTLALTTAYTPAADRPLEPAGAKPNILWITAEDTSPDLGCYGNAYASTPNLDRFAQQGVRYTHAFATIGVCAPARSTLITGMYPPSIGTQHMRCNGRLPDTIKCFSEYLRQAGYYCTNNVKTDYNFKHGRQAWDESSGKAHWRNRKPGQPFFAVFNLGSTHESQTWNIKPQELARRRSMLKPEQIHDPAKVPIPPYHPDAPEVRQDWAVTFDNISYMDLEVADLLKQLEDDGLAEDTLVFFYSDHGTGLPRSKRWLYETSLRVPLIIRFPEKYKRLACGAPGSTTDRLVSFVDFAPTMLSLAGVKVPQHMQGVAFLGERAGKPRDYIYGFRDRMDERYDMIRCVRDHRYKYIRNFMPHKPYFLSQHLHYSMNKPLHRVWEQWAREGKLNDVQMIWMRDHKPLEELYDAENDPYEIHNLAGLPQHQPTLKKLRKALFEWEKGLRDLSLLPEAEMRDRAKGTAEYQWARSRGHGFPWDRVLETAWLPVRGDAAELVARLKDSEPAVRYWALTGLMQTQDAASEGALAQVQSLAASDASFSVRLAAAEWLARRGHHAQALPVLEAALMSDNEWVRLHAANIADDLDRRAQPLLPLMQQLTKDPSEYVYRVMEHAVKAFEN